MKKQNRWLMAVLCGLLVGASMAAPLERVHAAPASEKQASQVVVNVNKATADELEGVKGIGPMLAARILDYREANGPFRSLEDLIGVPGIGQAKLEKIKGQLTV